MRSNYNATVRRPAQQLALLRACSLSAFLLAPAALGGYRVSTIAGNPCAIGTLDGQGAGALLDAPAGLAWDDAAQVGYVVDVTAQVVRRFTIDGKLTTIAGVPGSPGLRDGPGGTALFNFPTDVALDSAGNLFVADSQNHAIRKIDSADFVSTVTGSLTAPTALIVAPSGDIFVVDNNRQIKVVSQSGAVRSLAGDQSAPAIIQDGWEGQARFRSVQSIAFAPNGLIFVTDTCTVRTITADGYVSTFAGLPISECFDPAPAQTPSGARFNTPSGIAVDSIGNIYVADAGNGVVQRITRDGQVSVIAGTLHSTASPQDGAPGVFGVLRDITVTSNGKLWITDMRRDMPPPCRNGATVRSVISAPRQRAVRH